eukprot:GAHX01001474.1.p2 GENE.GAHX01001474.1~~GAHX01001474.1.p2  ORF type:complete len:103 (+),score=11.15 GAHX01001474.1:132-440(+)
MMKRLQNLHLGRFRICFKRRGSIEMYEPDNLLIAHCFSPGDVVRCKVVERKSNTEFLLSTTGDEFGVIYCVDLYGNPLTPQDWTTMVDNKGIKYKKKVAKIL